VAECSKPDRGRKWRRGRCAGGGKENGGAWRRDRARAVAHLWIGEGAGRRRSAPGGPTDRFPWWATGEAFMPTAVSRMTQRIICGTDPNSGIGPLVRHGMPCRTTTAGHWQALAKPLQGFQKNMGWIMRAQPTLRVSCPSSLVVVGGGGRRPRGDGPRALAAAEEVVPPPEDKVAVRQFDGEGVAVTPPLHLRWPRLPVGVWRWFFVCLSEIGAENKVSKKPRSHHRCCLTMIYC